MLLLVLLLDHRLDLLVMALHLLLLDLLVLVPRIGSETGGSK